LGTSRGLNWENKTKKLKRSIALLKKIVELNLTLVCCVAQINFRVDDSGVISFVDTGTKRGI